MNGIYHADFNSPLGSGSGTVYLEGNTFRGGDHVMAYFGPCEIKDNVLQAEMSILKHGEGFSILGNATKAFIKGTLSGDTVIASVTVPGMSITATVRLRKVSDL